MSLNYIQNDILDIRNAFVPLVSTNTMSNSGQDSVTEGSKGGRPINEKTDSNSTIANREADTNQRK